MEVEVYFVVLGFLDSWLDSGLEEVMVAAVRQLEDFEVCFVALGFLDSWLYSGLKEVMVAAFEDFGVCFWPWVSLIDHIDLIFSEKLCLNVP